MSLTVGFVLLIGDQASDQDWVLNLPKTKDKGTSNFPCYDLKHLIPYFNIFTLLEEDPVAKMHYEPNPESPNRESSGSCLAVSI